MNLGRFDRWNSWDAVHQPIGLLRDIVSYIVNPITHLKVCGVTAVLSLLLLCMYFFLKSIKESRVLH